MRASAWRCHRGRRRSGRCCGLWPWSARRFRRREQSTRWDAHDTAGAIWATDNLADAGQVLVTPRGEDQVLPDALRARTAVLVVR